MLTLIKVNNKYLNDVMLFTFNFEQIQQINRIFLLLTLNMYLSVGHRKQVHIKQCGSFFKACT